MNNGAIWHVFKNLHLFFKKLLKLFSLQEVLFRANLCLIVAIVNYWLGEDYQEKVVLMDDREVKINISLLSDAVQKELYAVVQNVNIAHHDHYGCCCEIRTYKEVVQFGLIILFDRKLFIGQITLIFGSKFKVHRHLMECPHGEPEIIPKILPLCFFLLVNLELNGAPVIA